MNVNKFIDEIRNRITILEGDVSDEKALSIIEEYVFSHDELSLNNNETNSKLINRIFCSIRKELDILDKYINDPQISEIMVNGKDNIFIEKKGKIIKVGETFETTENLEEVIRRAVAFVHREINDLNPIVDARLEDGSRINGVYKNIAIDGPILTIRKFPQKALEMQDLIEFETITQEAAEYLKLLVEAGYNLFISGGTSSGKTTFLNVLSDYIPEDQRVIVIEDSAELQIRNIKNIVRMECKNSNVEGKGNVSMEQLIKTSMRMRPDRIIVGEIRGKEVIDMIQACNTGHSGSMSTGHGNSVKGMLRRLESMYLQSAKFPVEAIRNQIAEGIDIIVHLGKLRDIGRKVLEISELIQTENGNIEINLLFKYSRENGLHRTENKLKNREKLELYFGDSYGHEL